MVWMTPQTTETGFGEQRFVRLEDGSGVMLNTEGLRGGPLSTITPKHMLKAWTNVRLPGALNRWQVGGSVHAQSKTTINYCQSPVRACFPVEAVQPEYAVFDLRAGFDVDRNSVPDSGLNSPIPKGRRELMGAFAPSSRRLF